MYPAGKISPAPALLFVNGYISTFTRLDIHTVSNWKCPYQMGGDVEAWRHKNVSGCSGVLGCSMQGILETGTEC